MIVTKLVPIFVALQLSTNAATLYQAAYNTASATGNAVLNHYSFISSGSQLCCIGLAGQVDNASIPLPQTLAMGVNVFNLWIGGARSTFNTWALNLYLDPDTTVPEISAFAEPSNSILGPYSSFFANPATNAVYGGFASGTLSYTDGVSNVTLTKFGVVEYLNNGTRDVISNTAFSPDGFIDGVIRFELTVTAAGANEVPEPGSLILCAFGIGAIVLRRASRRLPYDSPGGV